MSEIMGQNTNLAILETTPNIELISMSQRAEIRDQKEDWTGKTSTAERRKLQNRLNKRASRRRRMGQASGGVVDGQRSCSRAILNAREHAAVDQSFLNRVKWNAIMIAPDFASYSDTPLPVDQKLLTLLHFNLLRALTRNILLLGINPFHMELDIESPFTPHLIQPIRDSISLENLPPTLRPTMLQKTVRHHPEIDVLPFPTYRDNLLQNGAEIDEEVCTDMMYGVVEDNGDGLTMKRTCHGGPFVYGGRTGLIVWDEPWKQSSWEVDEKFARKWKKLLVGCQELLQSTNRWRAVRGEPALSLDD